MRELLVARVQRAIDAGILVGDPIDLAHVLLALTQGLAAQETAGWLGTSAASVDRRWALAVTAVLDGHLAGARSAVAEDGAVAAVDHDGLAEGHQVAAVLAVRLLDRLAGLGPGVGRARGAAARSRPPARAPA